MEFIFKLFLQIQLIFKSTDKRDPFWLLEYLLMLSGNHYKPKKWWQIVCWFLYHLLALYQYCLQWLIVINNIAVWNDTLMVIWSSITVLILTLCYVKQILLEYYKETIRRLLTILKENSSSSVDSEYGRKIRSRFFSRTHVIIISTMAMIILDQIIIIYPSYLRNRLYGIPNWVYFHVDKFAPLLIAGFYPVFVLVWVSKLFSASVTVAILLIGLKGELQILARSYERAKIMDENLQEMYYQSQLVRVQFWRQIKRRIQLSVKHHVHLLEHIYMLQEMFEKLFFLIYYQSLIVVGAVLYLILKEDFSLCSVAIVFCVIIFVLECYWWCYQIDTFESINDSISESLLVQCSQLPYSGDCHSEYVQTRTSLMIIASCSRSSVRFSCFGMCQISMVVFASLMNTCYSVLMFLVNICG